MANFEIPIWRIKSIVEFDTKIDYRWPSGKSHACHLVKQLMITLEFENWIKVYKLLLKVLNTLFEGKKEVKG